MASSPIRETTGFEIQTRDMPSTLREPHFKVLKFFLVDWVGDRGTYR